MAFIIKMGCENNNASTHNATHVVPSKKSLPTLLFDPETTNFQFETNQFIKDFSDVLQLKFLISQRLGITEQSFV